MKTWKLWYRLHNPIRRHPVFLHVVNKAASPARIPRWMQFLGLAIIAMSVCAVWAPHVMLIVLGMIVISPMLFMLLNGTIYGFLWAADTSALIARMRNQGKIDLLSTTPIGRLGINWMLCTGTLHRRDMLPQIHRTAGYLLGVAFGLVVLFTVVVIGNALVVGADALLETGYADLIVTLGTAYALILGLLYDHIQSIVQSSLVGMLIPALFDAHQNIRAFSGITFLLLQMIGYGMIALVYFDVLPWVYRQFTLAGLWADLSRPFVAIMMFFLFRELLFHFLWRLLLRLTYADTDLLQIPPFRLF